MRTLRLLLGVLSFLCLTSCATTRTAEYLLTPNPDSTNTISVVVTPNLGREDGVCFALTNTSTKPFLVDWDSSYLVLDGRTYRCIHAGIRFMEKAAPQAQSPVAPGSKISDCLFPADNIAYSGVYSGWQQEPLGVSTGEYSIAIVCDGKKENVQGSFAMTVKGRASPSASSGGVR